ncbi:glycosyltransferase [candidate division CSSED10-310 bacterium]|uniref:Glycosyltransferase n=1 Tax=candidate division CSSED10-310 bacterium TaxID=2855610 RepID=A0ABV6YZW7_UNCC1
MKTYPACSIIIPARNEEHNLPQLLTSLNQQEIKPTEILVVDDHSTDKTAHVARSFGARVIEARELPPGWVGKAWACHQGAQQAEGEVFIFLDADITMESDGLKKIFHTFLLQRGVVSLQPYHRVKKPYENLSAFFNIMIMAGMNAFTLLGKRWPPTGLFGPSLITSRQDYFQVGGHEKVKNRILEDLFLGQEYLHHDIPLRLYGGKGCLSFRMYPNGIGELIQGWSKAFATGASHSSPLVLILTVLWIAGSVISTTMLIRALVDLNVFEGSLWLSIYAGYAVQYSWIFKRLGTFSYWTSLFFPIPLSFFFYVFGKSLFMKLFQKKVIWKDRGI